MQKNLNTLNHLSFKKVLFSFEEVEENLKNLISNGQKEMLITLNTEMFMDSIKDREFREIVSNSTVILDSVGICYLFSKKNGIKVSPLNGIEVAEKIIEKGYRTFIVGSKKENIVKAVNNLKQKYPQSNIVGFHDGYFESSEPLIQQINRLEPEVLLVGMGSPKQERWIYQNMNALKFNLGIGIGGSIDVWAGVFKRAPFIIRKMGLEWMYRFATDLKRIPRITKIIKFTLMAVTGRI
ncbi:MAG: WecB/TagA/CpsF family glycosyltransferase [bacterium]